MEDIHNQLKDQNYDIEQNRNFIPIRDSVEFHQDLCKCSNEMQNVKIDNSQNVSFDYKQSICINQYKLNISERESDIKINFKYDYNEKDVSEIKNPKILNDTNEINLNEINLDIESNKKLSGNIL